MGKQHREGHARLEEHILREHLWYKHSTFEEVSSVLSKVVKACERARLFSPAVYLYVADKQFDSAIKVMMERAPAFVHDIFLDAIVKVRNNEVMYKAVGFYLTMHPTLFTRLMEVVASVVDHARVVNQIRRTGDWALQVAQPYLKQVQNENLSAVNESLTNFMLKMRIKKRLEAISTPTRTIIQLRLH